MFYVKYNGHKLEIRDDDVYTRCGNCGIKDQFGLDAETYSKAWAIYQNDDLKADQKRQQLSALGYNGSALYKALGQKLG